MKLKRRFTEINLDYRQISTERLCLSIVVALASAFAIYGIMYSLRELMRLMSHGFGHLPNILTEFERNTYNWFFAAIAVIFGNSIAISLILSGPNKGFSKRNIKRRRIINDNTSLNFYFLFWCAKISFAIGLLSIGFADFNLLPSIIIPIILVILVLYLETWKTLITVLKRNKYKVMLIHFILIVSLSFGLSKLEFVDYKKTDANQLRYSPIIDLPSSDYSNVSYMDYFEDVYLDTERDKVLFGYYENSIEDSNTDFLDVKLGLSERVQSRLGIRVSANKNTKMGFVKTSENKIRDAGINYMIYAIKADDIAGKRFSSSGIKLSLKDTLISEDDLIESYYGNRRHYYDKIENKIYNDTLKIEIYDNIKIDGILVPKKMLIRKLLMHIDSTTVFEYSYNSITSYQNYIDVLSSHLKVLNDSRNENRKLEEKFDSTDTRVLNKEAIKNELKSLREEFPFNYIENYNIKK